MTFPRFSKYPCALTDPGADIPLPPESSLVDWEAELVVVFGRRCRRVSATEADTVVFGYVGPASYATRTGPASAAQNATTSHA